MSTCPAVAGTFLAAALSWVFCGGAVARDEDSIAVVRVGLDAGIHSASASGIDRGFDAGPIIRLTLLDLRAWSRTRWAIAVSYWHATTGRPMAVSDDAKGVDVELRWEVLTAGPTVFSLGPLVGVEGINHAAGGVFIAGVAARGEWPLYGGRILFLVRAAAQTGSNLSVNVSGYSYSFFVITAGLGLDLGKRE